MLTLCKRYFANDPYRASLHSHPRPVKALWPGRKAFGDDGQPKIAVIKGQAGPVNEDPYQVDGLSGATITARGVSHLVQFWLGNHGFGPYLKQFKERGS